MTYLDWNDPKTREDQAARLGLPERPDGNAYRVAVPCAFYATVRSRGELEDVLAGAFCYDNAGLEVETDGDNSAVVWLGWDAQGASLEDVNPEEG